MTQESYSMPPIEDKWFESNLNEYIKKRDAWKMHTENWDVYDLVVREYEKIINHIKMANRRKPLPLPVETTESLREKMEALFKNTANKLKIMTQETLEKAIEIDQKIQYEKSCLKEFEKFLSDKDTIVSLTLSQQFGTKAHSIYLDETPDAKELIEKIIQQQRDGLTSKIEILQKEFDSL